MACGGWVPHHESSPSAARSRVADSATASCSQTCGRAAPRPSARCALQMRGGSAAYQHRPATFNTVRNRYYAYVMVHAAQTMSSDLVCHVQSCGCACCTKLAVQRKKLLLQPYTSGYGYTCQRLTDSAGRRGDSANARGARLTQRPVHIGAAAGGALRGLDGEPSHIGKQPAARSVLCIGAHILTSQL